MKSILIFYDSGKYFIGVIKSEDKDYYYVENLLELVIMLKKSEIEIPAIQTQHQYGTHAVLPVLSPMPAGFGLLSNCAIRKKSLNIFRIFSPQEIDQIEALKPLKDLIQ